MDTPVEPKALALARAIHELLETNDATEHEREAALQIATTLERYLPTPEPRTLSALKG